jgi:salicylate hydroxylase
VASSRNIIVAGAGIGGLSAALLIARAGFRVTVVEQAPRLEETGAGIQLSPNATRILIALGLEQRLRRDAFTPSGIAIRTAAGANLATLPVRDAFERRYGAPYWCIHRADLQAALIEAVRANPDIALRLGQQVEDYVVHAKGLTVACRRQPSKAIDEHHGIALIGADGLWSSLRDRLGHRVHPEFRNRTAWRALVSADKVEPEYRTDEVQLWLGHNAHVVHYPVRGGALFNLVAIVTDDWADRGWSAVGDRQELLDRFSPWYWAEPARQLLAAAECWLKWALYDLPPLHQTRRWGDGPVTLLGDAAHPMLPFLAQGAAMAIEDGAVLADKLAARPDDPSHAMRTYERARVRRTARVQRAARRNGRLYHLTGAEALMRNLMLRASGPLVLPLRYKWLYGWRFTPAHRAANLDVLPGMEPGEE